MQATRTSGRPAMKNWTPHTEATTMVMPTSGCISNNADMAKNSPVAMP